MNFGEIKAFQPDQVNMVRPETALNKQLQQDGLKQANELQQSFAKSNQSMSDNQKVASRVLSISINQSLTIEGRSVDVTPKEEDADKKVTTPFFDFEEVAKNVLNFVGNVIKNAAAKGAPTEKLNSLLEEARSGVSTGFKLAEDELGKNTTDDVKEGIAKSKSAIFEGIQGLENRIFNKLEGNDAVKSKSFITDKAQLSEFSVQTRDGDTVNIQLSLRENLDEQKFVNTGDANGLNVVFQQTTSFSLQVEGELDKNELKAIADLIAQADDITDMFYKGNIEETYSKALEIGFDNKQLAGFALQLTKVESSQKMQKYGEVQQYSENTALEQKAPKAVAEYLNKVLDAYSQSKDKLDSEEDFKAVINSLVNELKDVQVPDILTAINRFHTFNAKLIEGLNTPKP
jgi:hypothetical protein